MSEILKEDINIDGILIAPKNEELAKCVPFSIISPIFILQQGDSLRGIFNCSDLVLIDWTTVSVTIFLYCTVANSSYCF